MLSAVSMAPSLCKSQTSTIQSAVLVKILLAHSMVMISCAMSLFIVLAFVTTVDMCFAFSYQLMNSRISRSPISITIQAKSTTIKSNCVLIADRDSAMGASASVGVTRLS